MTGAPDVLLSTPPDDAGAQTADRYNWQAAVAAADGLALAAAAVQAADGSKLAAGGSVPSIVCEHHEDYVVVEGDAPELVSVKHRELQRGAWTWATLVHDGGLAHMFGRWLALSGDCRCRMVTNAGLGHATGLRGAARLLASCEALRANADRCPDGTDTLTIVRAFAVELMHAAADVGLPQSWHVPPGTTKADTVPEGWMLDEVRNFLTSLRIDVGRPHRDDMEDAAPSKYVKPLLALLGMSPAHAPAAWEAVYSLFRRRMAGRGEDELGALGDLLAVLRGETDDDALRRRLRRRQVSVGDILTAIRTALDAPGAYEPMASATPATRLAVKLIHGGCTPTTVRTAEALAEQWRRTRRELIADVPGRSAEFTATELELRQVASVASECAAAEATGGQYGSAMCRELEHRSGDVAARLPVQVDRLVALGGVFDLASRCQVWFGPEFDVETARNTLRAQYGVATGPQSTASGSAGAS